MTETAPRIEGFTFVEHLGSGGYSDVYLYERRSPRMRVAVKVLKDGRLGESERKQFAAEAETMAELADHPYIVQVFSADTTPDGRPYLVMKYYPPPNMGVRAARQRYSVDSVLRASGHPRPVPTVMTCGTLEENLANNRIMARALSAQGYDVTLREVRDVHSYTAWRDAFEPSLTRLIREVDRQHQAPERTRP